MKLHGRSSAPSRTRPTELSNSSSSRKTCSNGAKSTITLIATSIVLLVVALCVIELACWQDLCRNKIVHTLLFEQLLEFLLGLLCKDPLFLGVVVDRAPIWCSKVVALTIPCRRIVLLPEFVQQFLKRNFTRLVYHLHDLRMVRLSTAHFLVGRIGRHAPSIAHCRAEDSASQAHEQVLGAPKAPHAKEHGFGVCWIWGEQGPPLQPHVRSPIARRISNWKLGARQAIFRGVQLALAEEGAEQIACHSKQENVHRDVNQTGHIRVGIVCSQRGR
mmetsp:Transcript_86619/g.279684  ORF Transcript_86619/g.279684 Transcript_86619/m.279684 type:complete len:274 (-) Transcript_86619:285-1106(-)